MRSRILFILLGMAMGWTVTGNAATLLRPDDKSVNLPPPPYTERRWVGLRQKGLSACPPVEGWRADSLLDLALSRAGEGAKSPPRPRESVGETSKEKDAERGNLFRKYDLDRLCVYTAEDPSSKPFPKPLPPGLVKAERDRMGVASMGTPPLGTLGDQTWSTLADHFLDQIGKVQLVRTAKPSVRLVFIDTHRTGEELPEKFPIPNSWHGYTMAHYAQQLACSNDAEPQRCAIHVATRLALRYDHFDPNMSFSTDPAGEEGGHLGLISDLATAILAEIEQWQETEPETKLILNLSVGWDGELHGTNGISDLDARKVSELEPSTQSVYNALRYAAHRGVLVIAAAGNRRGGPQKSQWPLLPAAWELRQPSWLPFPLHRAVYAVGGLDWQGLPLPNSRQGGRPWRMVYGDHAVVRTGTHSLTATPESTMIYTGTSVSAAVASSIAAVVWRLRPNLGPAQVMRLISHSGEILDNQADFYAWNWKPLSLLIKPPHLRRLSLCRAVMRICGPDERRCPNLESIDCELREHSSADLSLLQPIPVAPTNVQEMGSPTPCNPGTSAAGPPCPMELYLDMSIPDAVNTQPPENPCPSCNIVPDPPHLLAGTPPGGSTSAVAKPYAINVELGKKWYSDHSSDTITEAYLVIACKTGPPPAGKDISKEFPSTADTPVKIPLGTIGDKASLEGCTATVDFSVKIGNTTEFRADQSSVYVDP